MEWLILTIKFDGDASRLDGNGDRMDCLVVLFNSNSDKLLARPIKAISGASMALLLYCWYNQSF